MIVNSYVTSRQFLQGAYIKDCHVLARCVSCLPAEQSTLLTACYDEMWLLHKLSSNNKSGLMCAQYDVQVHTYDMTYSTKVRSCIVKCALHGNYAAEMAASQADSTWDAAHKTACITAADQRYNSSP